MSKLVKNLMGLSFAAYCTVSAIWLGKTLDVFTGGSDDKKKRKKTRGDKWFVVHPEKDDD